VPIARNHHYISQCYLKGFVENETIGKFYAYDLANKKSFFTSSRNVGAKRDFNRVEVDGVAPDIVESEQSKVETVINDALLKLKQTHLFVGEIKIGILLLVALIFNRNPSKREGFGDFFDIPKEHLIVLETSSISHFVELLLRRTWVLFVAKNNAGHFITSDNPVVLTYDEPDQIPSFYRNSPGLAVGGTELYFPITKNLAIIGRFDEINEGVIEVDKNMVAAMNTKIFRYAKKQIYSPTKEFYFIDKNLSLCDGEKFIEDCWSN
jgi:hypothetical protein